MPAALNIDREQVQMLALTYGVREAARQLGLSESTVKSWSTREGWLADAPRSTPMPPTVVRPASGASIAPVNALLSAMKGDALNGRAFGLRLTRRALENIDKLNTDAELCTKDMADIIHTHIKSASIAGGYSSADTLVKVNLGLTGQSSPTIEAEIVTQDAGAEELP